MTTEMVDWQLAVTLGSRLAGAGPVVTEDEAAATVAELREGADRSTAYVRAFTGLEAGERTAPVLVVDRPAWIQANADGFASILSPVMVDDQYRIRKAAASQSTVLIRGESGTGKELAARALHAAWAAL